MRFEIGLERRLGFVAATRLAPRATRGERTAAHRRAALGPFGDDVEPASTPAGVGVVDQRARERVPPLLEHDSRRTRFDDAPGE
jgi:hypothetical protein